MTIVCGYDSETTGLSRPEHRIIEVNLQLWHLESRVRKLNWTQRINPMRSIAADAQRVHGITLADLTGQPAFKDVAPTMLKIMAAADMVVAHNGRTFDLPFVNDELKENGFPKIELPLIDTMEARWATFLGKVPNLGELCFACGVEYDTEKAHAADYDVDVMMQCFFKAIEWGFIDPTKAEVV
jgi:DNA polymerase-3 subunit epsilon